MDSNIGSNSNDASSSNDDDDDDEDEVDTTIENVGPLSREHLELFFGSSNLIDYVFGTFYSSDKKIIKIGSKFY